MEEKCNKCGRGEDEVKLLDVIYEGEILKMCEECAVVEDVIVLRRPTTFQLRKDKEGGTVYERLRRLSGLDKEEKKRKEEIEKILFKKEEKKDIKSELEKAKKRNIPLKLIDNFNWYITISRRRKKLSKGQLAEIIGESEEVIDMIEKGILPDDALSLILKLEQFFNIKLRKGEPVKEENVEESKIRTEKPATIIKLDRETIGKLKIADLIEMKKRKEELEKKKELSEEEIKDIIWRRHQEIKKKAEEKDKEEEKVETSDIKKEKSKFKKFVEKIKGIGKKFKKRKSSEEKEEKI